MKTLTHAEKVTLMTYKALIALRNEAIKDIEEALVPEFVQKACWCLKELKEQIRLSYQSFTPEMKDAWTNGTWYL